MQKILIADHSEINRSLLYEIFASQYELLITDSSEEIKNYTEMYSLMGYADQRDESGIIVQTNKKRKESFLAFNKKGLIVTAHSDLKHESEILETLAEVLK